MSWSRLCGADDVSIFKLEGKRLPAVAHRGPLNYIAGYVTPAVRGTVSGLCVLERRPVHVADLQAAKERFPEGSAIARELGHRTIVAVPLLREGAPLGAIVLRRSRVEPFTDKQIELVTTFADQAVIAIENARLFKEVQARTRDLTESLEQQTAMSEILSVISSSPGELQPVFEATLRNAVRICGAKFGQLFSFNGKEFRVVATRDVPRAFLERRPSIPADPRVPLGRVASTKQVVRLPISPWNRGTSSVFHRSWLSPILVVPGRYSSYRCSKRPHSWGPLASSARRCVLSQASRLTWSRVLPTKR